MHPDTEDWLTTLRYRLNCDRAVREALDRGFTFYGESLRVNYQPALMRAHAARIGAFLRSLRDWPQPGRPA